jgi:hypothetical protein
MYLTTICDIKLFIDLVKKVSYVGGQGKRRSVGQNRNKQRQLKEIIVSATGRNCANNVGSEKKEENSMV